MLRHILFEYILTFEFLQRMDNNLNFSLNHHTEKRDLNEQKRDEKYNEIEAKMLESLLKI
jgi:hypothetical protein